METIKESNPQNIRDYYVHASLLSSNPFSKKSITDFFQSPLQENIRNYLQILNQSENLLSDAEKILPKINESDQWSEICIYASGFKMKHVEDLWIMGLEKFNHSRNYRSHIISYYLSEEKYHKALTYIQKNDSDRTNSIAGIIASYELAQYHMVLDYYSKLSAPDLKSLDEDIVNRVAYAAMQTNRYEIAEELYTNLVREKGGKPIPTLQESLISQFGTEAKMNSWAKAISTKIRSKKNLNEIPVSNWVLYGSVLMHQEKYNDALDILLKARSSYSQSM